MFKFKNANFIFIMKLIPNYNQNDVIFSFSMTNGQRRMGWKISAWMNQEKIVDFTEWMAPPFFSRDNSILSGEKWR